MTEEKLFTIDELMEGKQPGSVIISHDIYHVIPYFLDRNNDWVCRSPGGYVVYFEADNRRWKLYTELNKKRTMRLCSM